MGESNQVVRESDLTTSSGYGGVLIEDTEYEGEKHVTLFCVGCGEMTEQYDIFADTAEENKGLKPIHEKASCHQKADEVLGDNE